MPRPYIVQDILNGTRIRPTTAGIRGFRRPRVVAPATV